MDQLYAVLSTYKSPKILDIATGSGAFLEQLSNVIDHPSSLIGIDVKEEAIEAAKLIHTSPPYEFYVMDAHKMSFQDNSFDIVAICNSLHHLESSERVVEEMIRVLKPGGSLVVYEMISDDLSVKQQTHMFLHHYWAQIDMFNGITHKVTYSRTQLDDLFNTYGQLMNVHSSEVEKNVEETEELLVSLKESVRRYQDKTLEFSDADYYIRKGNQLIQRIEQIGFDLATSYLLVFQKIKSAP
ncbi:MULTISPECIES: class I SAM-dependent methyltransferase [unclassified Fusibacter]|uniref:class I SAM-dependent methyltransferase n=1 Tax=unclassified Fusibacter TaxID=2624464 RepID=UPI00101293F1|nr:MULTISPECIES: class I SAM-dependent methyltransferase [unclassified Fusibacter]MCK8058350.1 class I SAM-dependent methyltransferase [Fusibacter sp. A2]NPE20933.1 class I SAM-dependent methyltransferase [Fusibacter sp. A1]RXV63136.1 class I SAM-dependent methyltransferase [Fusibacter sp. A1]